jgi:murein DD-endopeptidase MepM/ murein hydrolase activator NlpD
MNPLLLTRAAATAVVGGLCLALVSTVKARLLTDEAPPPPIEVAEVIPAAPIPEAPLEEAVVTHKVRRGESLGGILTRYGVGGAGAIRQAALEFTDLAKLRVGKTVTLHYRRGEPEAVGLSLDLDEDNELHVSLGETPDAWLEAIPYERRLGHRDLTIEGTLWNAALDAGLKPKDILRLAQIFEYDVDFNTELRGGDTFTLVMDELWLDGEYTRPGDFHAVRMVNRGRSITAIYFEDPVSGESGWFAPDGSTRRRPFLRSPLAFSQVTSGYNPSRMDPIAQRVIAHRGTDFGAPTGTPVRAAGDGVVEVAGWNGGYGNYVRIKHSGPYQTAYAHLSAISVHPGQRIEQGEVLGAVGTTGYSTGPHLHYEFLVNGAQVDAMTVDLPSSAELNPDSLPAFEAVRDRWLPLLDDPAAVADGAWTSPEESPG